MAVGILHTGQTGVERGAYRAARSVGFEVAGFCTAHGTDEFGHLSSDIRTGLTTSERSGARAAVYATLERANAVVIAVPNRSAPSSYTGIEALRKQVRKLGTFEMIVDSSVDLFELAGKLREVELRDGRLDLLVTGPRQTRWSSGERIGWHIVSTLAMSMPTSVNERQKTTDTDP